MRTFSDLGPSALISQLRENRTARKSEERICIIPTLNEPVTEPPVLIASGALGPISLMFAFNGTITSTLSNKMAMREQTEAVAYQVTYSSQLLWHLVSVRARNVPEVS